MKLVALIASLSATSKKMFDINRLGIKSVCLSRLSRENKRQAPKKLNEINAYRLVALIAPTEDAFADKRRPPVVPGWDLKFIKTQRNRTEAIGQPPDSLSKVSSAPSCQLSRYLIASCAKGWVRGCLPK